MRVFILVALLALLIGSSQAKSASSLPSVVSINLCTDQLVLLLAEPSQIQSLSNLSQDKAASFFYKEAQPYATNNAIVEEIVSLQPSLVVAGEYTSRYTLTLLRELGIKVETLPIASSLEMMFSNIGLVAEWLEQEPRGQEIVNDLKKRLQAIPTPTSEEPKPIAVYYDPNGYTAGGKSLRGEILTKAGWQNAASLRGIESYGSLSLESLVALAPDAMIDSPYSEGTFSRGQQLTAHPALRDSGLKPKVISIPSRQTICAGPWSVSMVEQLLAEKEALCTQQPNNSHYCNGQKNGG